MDNLIGGLRALATTARYLFFRRDRKAIDYDWVFIAGGGLLGGFTVHVWYPAFGPVVDGLDPLPALAGAFVLSIVVELIYPAFIRPRLVIKHHYPSISSLAAFGPSSGR